jgi:hypothetical protein
VDVRNGSVVKIVIVCIQEDGASDVIINMSASGCGSTYVYDPGKSEF